MTIDEAIEGSNEAVVFLANHHQNRLAGSVKLSIEALELIKAHPADSQELIAFKLKTDGHT